MGDIKDLNIKNQTYYFFNYMIDIKHFDSNLLKIDKNLDIYYIRYVAMKNISDIIESIRKYW